MENTHLGRKKRAPSVQTCLFLVVLVHYQEIQEVQSGPPRVRLEVKVPKEGGRGRSTEGGGEKERSEVDG